MQNIRCQEYFHIITSLAVNGDGGIDIVHIFLCGSKVYSNTVGSRDTIAATEQLTIHKRHDPDAFLTARK